MELKKEEKQQFKPGISGECWIVFKATQTYKIEHICNVIVYIYPDYKHILTKSSLVRMHLLTIRLSCHTEI